MEKLTSKNWKKMFKKEYFIYLKGLDVLNFSILKKVRDKAIKNMVINFIERLLLVLKSEKNQETKQKKSLERVLEIEKVKNLENSEDEKIKNIISEISKRVALQIKEILDREWMKNPSYPPSSQLQRADELFAQAKAIISEKWMNDSFKKWLNNSSQPLSEPAQIKIPLKSHKSKRKKLK